MFHACQNLFYSTFSILIALASPLITHASPLSATELPSSCSEARTLWPDDQERRIGEAAEEIHCYRLDLSSPGLLHLAVAVALGSPELHLDVLAAAETPALETLARSAVERLAVVGAGTYFVIVEGDDPRRPMLDYRLGSRFVEITKSDTDGEIEVEPEGFGGGCGLVSKSDTDGEIEVEPEGLGGGCAIVSKSDTDGEIEVEPEGFQFDRGLVPAGFLCRSGDGDDHGDSLACATPFDHHVVGELDNGWGDDADVFRFRLSGWRTVEVATEGGVDTHGTLFDQTGQRLAVDDDGGEGGNFRLVRTLGPGTYFVRVDSARSGGLYHLLMGRHDR